MNDKSLCNGRFLIHILHAIEPKAINWEHTKDGNDDAEKKWNA